MIDQSVLHVPVWVVILFYGALTALVIYVWNRLESRVKGLEGSEEDNLKKQAEAGTVLTMPIHDHICKEVHEHFEKTLIEKLDQMEKTFALMIRLQILEALKQYSMEQGQGLQGVQGIQGIQGKTGTRGRKSSGGK